MLVLPYGVEKNEVRRTPWVTWAIIGVCTLVHIGVAVLEPGAEREARQQIVRSLRYLGEHPYLSAPPGLVEMLPDETKAALEQATSEWEARGEEVDPEAAAQEQTQLNQMADEGLAALERTPVIRLGFVAGKPNPI